MSILIAMCVYSLSMSMRPDSETREDQALGVCGYLFYQLQSFACSWGFSGSKIQFFATVKNGILVVNLMTQQNLLRHVEGFASC